MAKTAELRVDDFACESMTPPPRRDDPTVDLVHLSRQTLGDDALETELLSLFERQAGQFAARLSAPMAPKDRKWRADLAHTLKGSARAIGASGVGHAAEAYETALREGDEDANRHWLSLSREISAARKEIAHLLGRA